MARPTKVPTDFVKALKGLPPAWDRWTELSPSHQREHLQAIEDAKKPETRARRIERAVRMIASPPVERVSKARAEPRKARAGGSTRRYAAFLRGVAPTNAKNSALKKSFEAAGFTDVKTVLASGNVVFSTRAAAMEALARKAERAMQEVLGRTFMTFVRPVATLLELLESDPFEPFEVSADEKRVVTFFREPPTKVRLPVERDGARILCVEGHEAFTAYVRRPGDPVFMRLIKDTFGDEVTTRTWDTVRKVSAS